MWFMRSNIRPIKSIPTYMGYEKNKDLINNFSPELLNNFVFSHDFLQPFIF